MPSPNSRTSFSAIIANGASLSAAVDIFSTSLHMIVMPDAWTAADLSFQGSADGTTYLDVYNDADLSGIALAAINSYRNGVSASDSK